MFHGHFRLLKQDEISYSFRLLKEDKISYSFRLLKQDKISYSSCRQKMLPMMKLSSLLEI